MSLGIARWLLFALLALTLPVPFVMAGIELAPLLRLVFLEAVMLAIVATDGGAGTAGLFAVMLAVQGALLALGLGVLAWGAGLLLSHVRPALRAACVGVAAACLVALSLGEIYRTPHSSSGPTANWLGIFD